MPNPGSQSSSPLPHIRSGIFDPLDVTVTSKLEACYIPDNEGTARMPMLNNYIRKAKVGGGQHGEVYLCMKLDTRYPEGDERRFMPVAMKSVKRNNPKAERYKKLQQNHRLPMNRNRNHLPLADKLNTTEQKIRKEIAIMKKLRHPHVVRLYEVIDDSLQNKIYMVMEYLGGGEVKWRSDDNDPRPVLTVAQTRRIIRDAVLGLEYLHYQGIIHRDIKPANLLWTEDRSQVKIGDFGVSHFSYAQRLAAAGKAAAAERIEAILMDDDSDLSKRAGTPSFLAPEVIWEYVTTSPFTSQSELPSPRSTDTLQSVSTVRPPVTKSIDIWALGVTLYCLLFGKVPFTLSSGTGSEYELYRVICNSDWSVGPTIGADEVETGGRHPDPTAPGASVIFLLDRFLQKDVHNRITLDQVKAHSWILQDLPDPERWLDATSSLHKIRISAGETDDAMSSVKFTWNWGARVTRRISNFFSKPRATGVRPQAATGEHLNHIHSDPHMRHPSRPSKRPPRLKTNNIHYVASSPGLFPPRTEKKDKGKKKEEQRVHYHPDTAMHTKKRQGSEQSDHHHHHHPSTSSSSASPSTDRPVIHHLKSWFAVFNSRSSERANQQQQADLAPDRSSRSSNHASQTSTHPQNGRDPDRMPSADPNTRRSGGAPRFYRSAQNSESGLLTAARRASSWGQGDEPLEFAEVMSVTSADLQLNDNDYLFGVGGVEPRSYKPRLRGSNGGGSASSSRGRPGDSSFNSPGMSSDSDLGSLTSSSPREGEAGPSNYAEMVDELVQQHHQHQIPFDASSSIISGYGDVGESKWVGSLSDDEDEEFFDGDDDDDDDDGGVEFGPLPRRRRHVRQDTDSFDEGVTFSPRKRPPGEGE